MSDWDADSDDGAASTSKPAPIAAAAKTAPAPAASVPVTTFSRRRFEDEDQEDEIQDDWEQDEEEVKPDVSSLQPIKKKSTVKQKIQEREAEERRRAELGLDSDDEDDDEETPAERRKREKEAQIEADVANAANLLGVSRIQSDDNLGSLTSAKPESKEDWEKFATDVYNTMLKSQANKPGYGKHFMPHFSKLLSDKLRDVDCRKQSADWKKIGEDKLKAEREKKLGPAAKKKAEKPKTVGTASAKNKIDTSAYGDEALGDDDDLDFM